MLGEEPRVELIPVRRNADGECVPLAGTDAAEVLRRVAELSARRQTTLNVRDGIASVNGLGVIPVGR
jgi:poly-gamma-glutamate synthesis protein (capsule biosynthesis protein)